MSRKGRPRGSKNHPTLFKVKRTKLDTVKLSRECLRIVHSRAHGSGLSPQTVLEDLIMAGDYTMGQAYDNLSNFRKRIREKASERNNVVPITSIEEPENQTNGLSSGPDHREAGGGNDVAEDQGIASRRDDAPIERGHRPEDNPAFGSASELGDVIGTVGAKGYEMAQDEYYVNIPDPGPEYVDEEGNPIEPQEVHEEEVLE